MATNQKVQAREEVCNSLMKDDFGASERVVRINTVRSMLGEADLIALVRSLFPFTRIVTLTYVTSFACRPRPSTRSTPY